MATMEPGESQPAGPAPGRRRGERRRGRGKKGRGGRGERRRPSPSLAATPLEQVKSSFVACGRCSYFLGGYQALFGQEHLAAVAEAEAEDNSLTLQWNQATRELLHKSFGGSIDREAYYYSVCCPECRRRFEYYAAGEETEEMLRVQVRPQGAA